MIVLRDDLAYIALTRDRKGGPMSDQLRPLMIAVSCPKVTLKGYFGLFSLISALALFACNDHPVEPIDQILSASNRIENRLPAKTKLDFLFVIDNSSSMGEEQRALAENFKTFSDFLFDELQGSADYRIAVTNTGIENMRAGCMGDKVANGRFLYSPADADKQVYSPDVIINGQTPEEDKYFFPETTDCEQSSEPVISSEALNALPVSELPLPPADEPSCADPESPACIKARRKLLLEKEFRCA